MINGAELLTWMRIRKMYGKRKMNTNAPRYDIACILKWCSMSFRDVFFLLLFDLSSCEKKVKDPSRLSEVSTEALELDGRDVEEDIDDIRLEILRIKLVFAWSWSCACLQVANLFNLRDKRHKFKIRIIIIMRLPRNAISKGIPVNIHWMRNASSLYGVINTSACERDGCLKLTWNCYINQQQQEAKTYPRIQSTSGLWIQSLG